LPERALVTGATGFIGHHLVRALAERGDTVRCLVRPTSDTTPLGGLSVEYVLGDVTDSSTLPPATDGVDVVYHTAGLVKALRPADLVRANVDGMAHLARLCADRPTPPRLVLLSSLAAAGPSSFHRPLVESDPPRPVSLYGRSKLAGERALVAFADRLPATVVRAPAVFGPRDREMYRIFRLASRGWAIAPTWRPMRLSSIYAVDLAGCLIRAAAAGERLQPAAAPGVGVYYAAFDEHLTVAEFARRAAAALGLPAPRLLRLPLLLSRGIALLAELAGRLAGRPTILNLDKSREAGAGSWTCSPAKAQAQLGFQPGATLDQRLEQTAEWYRQHHWL
jgi:dihydroflavonol-4-reductase